ncbi:hypothetical protein FOFC_13234 [Fusarium oxysporum]|nr:hypothetical protein FOFC_13234 [Fusarium oxysporum]
MRSVPTEEQIDRLTETRRSSGSGNDSGQSRRDTKWLQEALKEQMEMTRELTEVVAKQELTVHDMGKQMVKIKKNMAEKLQRVREQLETIVSNAAEKPQRSYPGVIRLTRT